MNEIIQYDNLKPEIKEKIKDLVNKNDFSEMEFRFVEDRVRNVFWDSIDAYEYSTVKNNKTPSFSQIMKYYGKSEAIKIANYIIRKKLKKFSEDDVMMICYHLLSEEGLPGATIIDLKLMMNMGLQGRFGKSYGEWKLSDVTGLNGWIDQYYEWRKKVATIEREKAKTAKSDKFLPSPNDIPAPEWFKEKTKEKVGKIGKGNLRDEISKTKSMKYYGSIEQYCQENDVEDIDVFLDQKIENYKELDQSEKYVKVYQLLSELNSPKK